MPDLSLILSAIKQGDPHAAEQLLPLVYDELRKLAAQRLAGEQPGQTIEATGLVHEAYLRLIGPGPMQHWDGRNHFFAAAAEAMRRILVETARRKQRVRHGGGVQRVDADLSLVAADCSPVDVLALEEALSRLAEESPVRAELVKLRYFAGLTLPEAAGVLGISRATAERYWTYARTRLYADLNDTETNPKHADLQTPLENS